MENLINRYLFKSISLGYGKNLMSSKSSTKIHLLIGLCLAFLSAAGVVYLYYAYKSGVDDILTMREIAVLAVSGIITFALSYLFSKKIPLSGILLAFLCALCGALAVNFEFPDLMKLPIQLPAENQLTIIDIDKNASLDLSWAYWFRPRTQDGDLFLTNPDRDISFSQLVKTGNWEEITLNDDLALRAGEQGASIGVSSKLRTHLAVFCLKAEGGAVTVLFSGEKSPITITPEMTESQPYRMVMKNGQLSGFAGNAVQIILWAGGFYLVLLLGIFLFDRVKGYQGKRKKSVIFISAFLLPCLIMLLLCIFLKITPFGEKTFLINDMWGEYADYMAYFRSILSGENDLFYSFSKSLGDDLLSLLAFYVINPLNWLVCLFPPERLPLAVSILVILRYGIAGLTASVYFVKRRNCGYSALLFSTCYALMSFHIVNAENTNLRESALLLPLVFLGLENLIENGSWRTYVLSLAGAIFLNFYSGYQICIFVCLYFLFYYFGLEKRPPFFKILFRFLTLSLLAAGLCAFLLIPVVMQLQNGPKTFDPSLLEMKINMPWTGLFGKFLADAYDVEQFKAEGLPNLYTGLIIFLLLPLYFLNHEISVRKRRLTAALFVCFILVLQINPLNLALHGFNIPGWWPYRYSFIICFSLLCTAQESFSHRKGLHGYAFFVTAFLSVLLIVFLGIKKYDWMTPDSLKLNSILLLVLLFILCLRTFRRNTWLEASLFILTMIELFLNASHVLFINTAYERSNTVNAYINYYSANQPVFDAIRNTDTSFYRTEKSHYRTANDPMLFGYNGITHYSSTLNKNVMAFLPRLGFRYYPYRFLYWEGSDIAADSLLGIKYLVSEYNVAKPYPKLFSEGKYTVYENPYALPIMFTASEKILDADDFSGNGGFELQNRLFSLLTGEESKVFLPAKVSGPVSNDLSTESSSSDVCWLEAEEIPGSLSWNIQTESNDTLYAFFPAENIYPVSLTLNDRPYGYYYDNFSYHILRLGSFENEEALSLTMTPLEKKVCLAEQQFYYEDLDALEHAVNILRRDDTELHKISSSHLEGSFTASADKMLFFSIPYSEGWTIKVDGEAVPVYKVFDTFMAVHTAPGFHSVELRYLPSGLIAGSVVSVLSLVIMLVIGVKRNRSYMNKEEGK